MPSNPIVFIVGPTASGKSDVAVELARIAHGEIVSCDSMQIYKHIRIASNKPPVKEQKGIKHYLLGCVPLEKEFDVATYNQLALKAINAILKKKKHPIVVGGSGLYVNILLDGIFEGGEKDDAFRRRLNKEAKEFGNEYLYSRLKKSDPASAQRIHPNDLKRLIRALEVLEVDKEPISKKQIARSGLWGKYDVKIFGLNIPRPALYEAIDNRVNSMLKRGLLSEVERIHQKKISATAQGLIGIKEMFAYLDGACCLEEAKALMQRNTRRLAKRQMTWFRRDKRIEWLDVMPNQRAQDIACLIKERAGI